MSGSISVSNCPHRGRTIIYVKISRTNSAYEERSIFIPHRKKNYLSFGRSAID